MSRIVLGAGSVADDLTYVALADISRLLDAQTTEYRIIGGLMVTALAVCWDLGASLYRETLDADLGVPPIVARDLGLARRLRATGYQQVAGDRFEDRCLTFQQESPAACHPHTALPSMSSCPPTRADPGRMCEWAPTS